MTGLTEKTALHPRNRHRGRYDFALLVQVHPPLGRFVRRNAHEDASMDFSDPAAVKALNQALLKQYYAIDDWDIPARFLCPPIPGRADYIHYIADLLAPHHAGKVPEGAGVRVLDIGVGANLIYPLLGQREYGWHFVGADVSTQALENAQQIIKANGLDAAITLRQQKDAAAIFRHVVHDADCFDLTMCNPPFHASQEDAEAGTRRKWHGLARNRQAVSKALPDKGKLNFGGQAAELYCEGGEVAFISRMVEESQAIRGQCLWFTSLVSRETSLPAVYRALKRVRAVQVRTVEMAQGQKRSRFVAWTFMNERQQQMWCKRRPMEPYAGKSLLQE